MRKILTHQEIINKAIKGDGSFYKTKLWQKTRLVVLELDNFECQLCKKHGKYTRATVVHHVQYVDKHPELALDIFYEFKGRKYRNLISLCNNCHEKIHNRTGFTLCHKKITNDEKW